MHALRSVVSGSFVAACAASLVACHADGLKGSGTVTSETRSVSGFRAIELASVGDLTLTQSGVESLRVEAEDNLLPHLTSVVAGDRLTLGEDTQVRPTKPVHYALTVKDLTSLTISGAGDVKGSQIQTKSLTIDIPGKGDVNLAGQVEAETISVGGAGDCDLSQLAAKTAKVTIGGAGDVTVAATDTVDATVAGMGDVAYVGNPKVTQHVTGAGKVHAR